MLNQSVSTLKGVGKVREAALHNIGIDTIGDLLNYYPRAYEDRTKFYTLENVPEDIPVCIKATVGTSVRTALIRKGTTITKCKIFDEYGTVDVIFFNRRFLEKQLFVGKEYVFFGKVTVFNGKYQMNNPEFELVGKGKISGKILPIYPLTEGITRSFLTDSMARALANAGEIVDYMPESIVKQYNLTPLDIAVKNIHFPFSHQRLRDAINRLCFNELITYSSALAQFKSSIRSQSAPKMKVISLNPFLENLPYELTNAQKKAVNDIFEDMYSGYSMNRLVQGDVGSGKTVVAAAAAYLSALNGYQSAVIAPTEILALQHYKNFTNMFKSMDVRIALLAGSTNKKEKEAIKTALSNGEIDLLIGTHALLEDNVVFKNPALFVVDEQHRFGVAQRSKLSKKGQGCHTLVMSATPIPRTLTLIIYGELDVSIIDELPPGRQKIDTFFVNTGYDKRLYAFIQKLINEGSQAYVVCPLALESEESDLASAEEYASFLQNNIFPDLSVAMLHGKLKSKEKQAIIERFKNKEIDILVSTTVVEVGVDVPNATLMVVRNAERFGLSQLHQLRGRVGRGSAKSYCILVSDTSNHETKERLNIMTKTSDGFKIAQEDLRLRGPGDFFGMAQHGLPKYNSIVNQADMRTVECAKEISEKIISSDPDLKKPENQWLFKKVHHLRSKLGDSKLN